ncbi:MAG: hypothetical protein JWN40_4917 [Phycisphaerales bacterium]|nr:hypothetical protein [Phycisphaerales bacterium]
MEDVDRPAPVSPFALDYQQAPPKANASRVLAKTAIVFTGIGAILFTVLGFFGVILACLSIDQATGGVWAIAIGLLIVAAIFIVATHYLGNVGKPTDA